MSDESLLLLALIVVVFGMACLALSIVAHWRQVMPARPQSVRTRIALRVAGAGLLAVAFVLCTMADPVMMAVLVWPMLLLIGAGIVGGGLTLHAQKSKSRT